MPAGRRDPSGRVWCLAPDGPLGTCLRRRLRPRSASVLSLPATVGNRYRPWPTGTPARYRWVVLGAGTLAQASFAAGAGVAPAFAALVGVASWRIAFSVAATGPLPGVLALRGMPEAVPARRRI